MPFAMASERPPYPSKQMDKMLRPHPNQRHFIQLLGQHFICNSIKDRLFLVMAEAYQISD
jgi:hypothetical protein